MLVGECAYCTNVRNLEKEDGRRPECLEPSTPTGRQEPETGDGPEAPRPASLAN